MDWLREQLGNTTAPDLLLHLGAGSCRELDEWLHTGARRIVLVEPNPELLPDLRARTETSGSVEIHAVAIADQAGRGALRLFNFPFLSSLRSPTGLYQILPGLTQIGRAMIETNTLDQLLEDLKLDPEGDNWLIIDTPGEEAAILDQLENGEKLHYFSRIVLTAGLEPLYEGAKSAVALVKRLESLGYNNSGRPDTRDCDWPRYNLALNRMSLECRQMRLELAQAQAWAQEETERANSLAAEREDLQARLDQTQKAHQAELESANQQIVALQQSNGGRVKELESALAQKQASSEKLGTDLHECKKELAKLRDAHVEAENRLSTCSELEGRAKQHHEENSALKSQLDQVTQSRDNLQKQLQKQNEEAHKLKIKVSQLEEENDDYKERHKLLEEELIKAEAQIDLIKQLFLSGDDALDWDDEPEKA